MILMMLGETGITTPSLKCLVHGHLMITSKKKLAAWLGNCLLKSTKFRHISSTSPTSEGTNCSIYQLMKSAKRSGSLSGITKKKSVQQSRPNLIVSDQQFTCLFFSSQCSTGSLAPVWYERKLLGNGSRGTVWPVQ